MTMNHKEKFNETVGILVRAYMDDTLEHANCSACAVGNIVAHAMGVSPVMSTEVKGGEPWRFSDGTKPMWQRVFCTPVSEQVLQPYEYTGEAKWQIDLTGYSWEELARIEAAFEKHSDRRSVSRQTIEYKDKQMFNGLMTVVDVLAEIHHIDLTEKESAKLLFVKA